MDSRLLQLNASDNVAVAREPLTVGEDLGGFTTAAPIDRGHKIALQPIRAGETIRKYGQRIGIATRDIAPGEHVHTHNVASPDDLDRFTPSASPVAPASAHHADGERTFLGYRRPDGRVGTRNYLGLLTTVNCSATVARRIAAHFTPERLAAFPNVDGVVGLTHSTGCGMGTRGEAADLLRRTTVGYATHPNFAGAVLLGLGCEANQLSDLVPLLAGGNGALPGTPTALRGANVRALTIQDEGGTAAAIRQGIAAVEAMLPEANHARRTPQRLGELVVALQCGGSDAWSGITANPALGLAVDRLVAAGGTAILSETPEIFGAEHLLTARAEPEVAARLMQRIAWWRDYAHRHGAELDNNPSPGNKAGGLTTILEKSLGAVAKGGSSPLRRVVEYAEPIRAGQGLVFMDSPGFDPVSATGQIASGANLLVFTTGRGSVYGAKPVPSLKLSTTTRLFERMGEDMDLNCGTVLDGTETLPQVAARLFEAMIATASGEPSRSERFGFGEEEFAPWQIGATL